MTIEASKNKILVVCTTTSSLSSSSNPSHMQQQCSSSTEKTGADVKEIAYIYHYLRKQTSSTANLTIAAPQSTSIPFDPMSKKASENDQVVKEFLQDSSALELFERPETLDSINPNEYSCVIFPGGPGCMFDLASTTNSSTLSKIVTTIYNKNDGIVAAIGHGLAALINVSSSTSSSQPSHRESWLKSRSVTCNTNEEEKDMQLDKALPFLLEQKLKEIGAKFQKGDKFQSYVVVDERLITGQNRNSVKEWMETVTKELKKYQTSKMQ